MDPDPTWGHPPIYQDSDVWNQLDEPTPIESRALHRHIAHTTAHRRKHCTATPLSNIGTGQGKMTGSLFTTPVTLFETRLELIPVHRHRDTTALLQALLTNVAIGQRQMSGSLLPKPQNQHNLRLDWN